jgi:ketosteroid isomerase-like protein
VTADTVRRMYDAIGRGDIETFVGALDPDGPS